MERAYRADLVAGLCGDGLKRRACVYQAVSESRAPTRWVLRVPRNTTDKSASRRTGPGRRHGADDARCTALADRGAADGGSTSPLEALGATLRAMVARFHGGCRRQRPTKCPTMRRFDNHGGASGGGALRGRRGGCAGAQSVSSSRRFAQYRGATAPISGDTSGERGAAQGSRRTGGPPRQAGIGVNHARDERSLPRSSRSGSAGAHAGIAHSVPHRYSPRRSRHRSLSAEANTAQRGDPYAAACPCCVWQAWRRPHPAEPAAGQPRRFRAQPWSLRGHLLRGVQLAHQIGRVGYTGQHAPRDAGAAPALCSAAPLDALEPTTNRGSAPPPEPSCTVASTGRVRSPVVRHKYRRTRQWAILIHWAIGGYKRSSRAVEWTPLDKEPSYG